MIRTLFILLLAFQFISPAVAAKKQQPQINFDISQTVTKVKLAADVTADDAVEAIKSKAIELNMKFVAHQPLSKELAARGIKSGRLEIFQFCNPGDAYEMVQFNPIFAAYMPCRIAMVEDKNGDTWLMMINLDMLINNAELPPAVSKIANKVNSILKQILQAGANGEF